MGNITLIMPVFHASIMTSKIAFLLLGLWWGTTAIIDFVVVPTVFSVINDFFNAGELGIALFRKFNLFELFFAISILAFEWRTKNKFVLIPILFALIIVIIYTTTLTPHLAQLSKWWKEAESLSLTSIHGVKDIQQEHQFYHRLYVSLDTLKILILSCVLTYKLFAKNKMNQDA
jgi:Domain of unknown function (DUF4149)